MRRALGSLARTPRGFTTIVATWLLASSFLWPHTQAQRNSAVISAVLVLLLEWRAKQFTWAHRFTGLVGSWLILALFIIWPRPLTAWNNLLVGLIITLLSMRDPDRPLLRRGP